MRQYGKILNEHIKRVLTEGDAGYTVKEVYDGSSEQELKELCGDLIEVGYDNSVIEQVDEYDGGYVERFNRIDLYELIKAHDKFFYDETLMITKVIVGGKSVYYSDIEDVSNELLKILLLYNLRSSFKSFMSKYGISGTNFDDIIKDYRDIRTNKHSEVVTKKLLKEFGFTLLTYNSNTGMLLFQ